MSTAVFWRATGGRAVRTVAQSPALGTAGMAGVLAVLTAVATGSPSGTTGKSGKSTRPAVQSLE
ncbi:MULTISPECIES: hypothetical protein [unclassified Streptomyces]|uniref:hypothetical protein n=1 Tax=unclassified Streptomyces TaxID=2593676 RepID=UPI0020247BAC|nr:MULTISPECIES: hypothetical protein [unclassified Streptomyces]MCX4550623.1 hypothetical protein [Streptomyces sp. NBC_01500]WSC22068.1 hypothetical protein OIE60_21570 [Streptomyces sp. NBC_01766]